jgi:hypothetical protein
MRCLSESPIASVDTNGNDLIGSADGNRDDIFCGAGNDTVFADEEDRVAENCEVVVRDSPLQATGPTPAVEVTITTPEGTITMTP